MSSRQIAIPITLEQARVLAGPGLRLPWKDEMEPLFFDYGGNSVTLEHRTQVTPRGWYLVVEMKDKGPFDHGGNYKTA